MISLHDVVVSRQGRRILDLPALTLDPRALTVVLGHNGSGKSTLMQLLARQMPPDRGELTLDEQSYRRWRTRAFARRVAYLPQRLPDTPGMSVAELVRLGRYPWRGWLARWQLDDQRHCEQALIDTDLAGFETQWLEHLSGGERQRAWIAMLLAQQAPLLLLDEPTAALDIGHQHELMTLLHRLNRETGRGMVVILHDINLALRFADSVVGLKRGRLAFHCAANDAQDADRLSQLYDTPLTLIPQPGRAAPVVVVP